MPDERFRWKTTDSSWSHRRSSHSDQLLRPLYVNRASRRSSRGLLEMSSALIYRFDPSMVRERRCDTSVKRREFPLFISSIAGDRLRFACSLQAASFPNKLRPIRRSGGTLLSRHALSTLTWPALAVGWSLLLVHGSVA